MAIETRLRLPAARAIAASIIAATGIALAPLAHAVVIDTTYEPIGPFVPGDATGLGGTTFLTTYSRFGGSANATSQRNLFGRTTPLGARPLIGPLVNSAPTVSVPELGNVTGTGVAGLRKGSGQRAESSNVSGSGLARAFSVFDDRTPEAPEAPILATCVSVAGAFASGALADAACVDPVPIAADTYENYTPTISELSIEIGGVGESARVEYTSSVDDELVYSLVIEAANELLGGSDLSISFTPGASIAADPSINAAVIESTLLGAFSVGGGIATLANDTAIFNAPVLALGSGLYTDLVNTTARVADTPTEVSTGPVPVALVALGLAVALLRRKPRG